MKAVLEQLEFSWWHFHIKLMDESKLIRQILPHFREIWSVRQDIRNTIAWALLGFPLGILLVFLQSLLR